MSLRLTRDQIAGFYSEGRGPSIEGDGACPVERGYVHKVSTRLSFRVTGVRWPKPRHWKLEYVVVDARSDQDRYLQPASHRVAVDDKGDPMPMTPEEELGYTTNPKAAIERNAPAVPKTVQDGITKEARNVAKVLRAEDEDRREARSLANRIKQAKASARKQGVDISPEVEDLKDRLDRIERRLGKAA